MTKHSSSPLSGVTKSTASPLTGETHAARFYQWLSQLTPEAVEALLRVRPDAATPPPPTLQSLATRLQLSASLARAVAKLTAEELSVIETAAQRGAEWEPVEATNLGRPEAVQAVRAAGLLYGDKELWLLPDVLRTVGALRVTDTHLSLDAIEEALADLSERERTVIHTLATSGGVGTTHDAAADADPSRPVPALIARGLIYRVDSSTVRLPFPVAQVARGVRACPTPLSPPAVRDGVGSATGAGEGLDTVRLLAQLIDRLDRHPVQLLRTGGIGLRETTHLSTELAISRERLAFLVGLGISARLLGVGEPRPLPADCPEDANYLAATDEATQWRAGSLAQQWAVLLAALPLSPWMFWKAGTPDDAGKTLHVLAASTSSTQLPVIREQLWASLSARPVHSALSADEAAAAFGFRFPVHAHRVPREVITQLYAEAQYLGLIDDATLTPAGAWYAQQSRAHLDGAAAGTAESALAAVASAVPEAVDQLIFQADLTVLAPGPLVHEVAWRMRLLSDVESPGLAAVYRITEQTLRAGMDAGMSADDILNFFTAHALGTLPEAVSYLVRDVARTHGSLRGGPAGCYVRSDDQALLLRAVSEADGMGLRLLAPTVAISPRPLVEVLRALREHGFAPAAEDASGAALDVRPEPPRLPTPRPTAPAQAAGHVDAVVAQAMKALAGAMAGEHGSTQDNFPAAQGSSSGDIVGMVESAVRGSRTVVLAVADKNGQISQRRVRPIRLDNGTVHAVDPEGKQAYRFSVERIARVLPA